MCDFELCLSGVFMHFMNFRAEAIFWDTKGHVPSTIFAAAHFCRDYKPNWSAQRVEKNVCLHVKHYTSSALFLHDQALQSDPRFRKYNQLIEKNLNSFDAVNEWADIISFLGRLLKVTKKKTVLKWKINMYALQSFQAYPQFPVIPRKYTVSKRLAQCLNPGFPAGVHQKTLDVYAYILETIGVCHLLRCH